MAWRLAKESVASARFRATVTTLCASTLQQRAEQVIDHAAVTVFIQKRG